MTLSTHSPAQRIIEICRQIATFSETEGSTTRTFLSPPMRNVHELLKAWMGRAGMNPWVDAVGNVRGVYRGRRPFGAARLLIGSHVDTVPNAGAFDGVLGVIIALALVEAIAEEGYELEYDVEVIAFSEEEGIRFNIPFIGSRALIGDLEKPMLDRKDRFGVTVAQAIEGFGLNASQVGEARLSSGTFAFLEFHIEQGPVLEDLGSSLGIVEAIAGQSRYELTFCGKANHAGTTPMRLRHDALAAAAEWIVAVERQTDLVPGVVATVGRIHAIPGAANVVCGEVNLTLDVRHAQDSTRLNFVETSLAVAHEICLRRKITLHSVQQAQQSATAMNRGLADSLEAACTQTGNQPSRLISGAGHDAMILARCVPAGMLFLRSPGGISHHPDESVLSEDVQAALAAGIYFLKHLNSRQLHQ